MSKHGAGGGNPFSTLAGALPTYLLGRAEVMGSIGSALAEGGGSLLLTGGRGIGKTVMLTQAGHQAKDAGWLVIDTYLADGGLGDRLHAAISRLDAPRRKLNSLAVNVLGSGISSSVERPEPPRENLSDRFANLVSRTGSNGLMLTVDEVHNTTGRAQQELRELGNEVQLAHRAGLPLVSVVAGLPGGIAALLRDRDEHGKRTGATFLRRSERIALGRLDDDEVWRGYRLAAAESGRNISLSAVDLMTEAVRGYPFMFQLVGHRVWEAGGDVIGVPEAEVGVASARRRLSASVLESALADLSPLEIDFLTAMASSDAPVRIGQVGAKLGISRQQADTYKKRLIDAEVVMQTGHGLIDFALPYLNDHLRQRSQ